MLFYSSLMNSSQAANNIIIWTVIIIIIINTHAYSTYDTKHYTSIYHVFLPKTQFTILTHGKLEGNFASVKRCCTQHFVTLQGTGHKIDSAFYGRRDDQRGWRTDKQTLTAVSFMTDCD